MLKVLPPVIVGLLLTLLLSVACAGGGEPDDSDAVIGEHMVAEATLAAHYIAAAVQAGMTPDEINATLQQIARETVISEFWISDETGNIEFSSVPGSDFSFGTDPNADQQAAPFAALLLGQESVVVQEAQPRDLDGAVFRYVAVVGVDGPRIVQVGLKGAE